MFQEERDKLCVEAKRRIEKIQAENRQTFNKRRKETTTYKMGDLVAIERTQGGPGLKLRSKFLGPYRVMSVLRNDRYMVQREGEHERSRTTSTAADHMKWWDVVEVSDASETSEDEYLEGRCDCQYD